MTVQTIMEELASKGNEGVKKILLKHGVKEPFFGVKIEDLKVIQKRVKKDYVLAKDLYATGNADAMYLAGLIADEQKMTKNDLQTWIKHATSNNIIEYTVPWITAESNYGYELALEWIESKNENIAAAGWSTLSSLVSIKPDSELDIEKFKALLQRVQTNIHEAENRVRSKMNGFIIAVGCYVAPLTNYTIAIAEKIGTVSVNVDGTACKVPYAIDYIAKCQAKKAIGKKKKMARC